MSMRRLIGLLVCISLLAWNSMVAYAEENSPSPTIMNGTGSKSQDVMGVFDTNGIATVYTVNITWGNLTFEYSPGTGAKWNSVSHTYDGGTGAGWNPVVADGGVVTVENHSNAAVTVTMAFAQKDSGGNDIANVIGGAVLTPTFIDKDLNNDGVENDVGTSDSSMFELETAEGKIQGSPPMDKRLLKLEGIPKKVFGTGIVLGQVTVTIAEAGGS